MILQAGTVIKSTEALNDTYFHDATILLSEYNSNGAVGFILNRPFHRTLNELQEFRNDPALPLFEGGPSDQEHLFFIHSKPTIIDNGTKFSNHSYFGGNFNQAIEAIKNNEISSGQIKIFVGYCGWDAGELEAEIEEGSWVIEEQSLR